MLLIALYFAGCQRRRTLHYLHGRCGTGKQVEQATFVQAAAIRGQEGRRYDRNQPPIPRQRGSPSSDTRTTLVEPMGSTGGAVTIRLDIGE